MAFMEKGSAAYRRTLFSILLGSIVTFAVLYSPQTLLGEFSNEFHVSPSAASMVISLSTLSLAFCMMFVSAFSNAWGRKRIMVASLFATSALAILTSFAHNFHLLLALRLLLGISLSGFPAIAMTYLNEEIAPGSIGKAMGVYVGGTAIGGFVGRVIVSLLTDLFEWNIGLLAGARRVQPRLQPVVLDLLAAAAEFQTVGHFVPPVAGRNEGRARERQAAADLRGRLPAPGRLRDIVQLYRLPAGQAAVRLEPIGHRHAVRLPIGRLVELVPVREARRPAFPRGADHPRRRPGARGRRAHARRQPGAHDHRHDSVRLRLLRRPYRRQRLGGRHRASSAQSVRLVALLVVLLLGLQPARHDGRRVPDGLRLAWRHRPDRRPVRDRRHACRGDDRSFGHRPRRGAAIRRGADNELKPTINRPLPAALRRGTIGAASQLLK
ncbi:MFS transporter [Paenibacillus lycopersici]|uniref:MFS transporter n=1 Tax=Paenibacillus lycopersici TaxID=2704462 RepID=A0A6C0FQZ8_9BACL|nr:MFS transporter [Paenibacillus lycopersici]